MEKNKKYELYHLFHFSGKAYIAPSSDTVPSAAVSCSHSQGMQVSREIGTANC